MLGIPDNLDGGILTDNELDNFMNNKLRSSGQEESTNEGRGGEIQASTSTGILLPSEVDSAEVRLGAGVVEEDLVHITDEHRDPEEVSIEVKENDRGRPSRQRLSLIEKLNAAQDETKNLAAEKGMKFIEKMLLGKGGLLVPVIKGYASKMGFLQDFPYPLQSGELIPDQVRQDRHVAMSEAVATRAAEWEGNYKTAYAKVRSDKKVRKQAQGARKGLKYTAAYVDGIASLGRYLHSSATKQDEHEVEETNEV